MFSIIIVGLSYVINALLFYLMYNGSYIPDFKTPIIISFVVLGGYVFVWYLLGEVRSRHLNRFLTISLTINLAYSLSSLVNSHWKLDSLAEPFTMMKISMVLLIGFILYLNIIYIRAEISYKRKRGNQRIRKEEKKSAIDTWRERKEAKDNDEIELVLGHSTEAEEKTPPI